MHKICILSKIKNLNTFLIENIIKKKSLLINLCANEEVIVEST
jgi:hypothetical protein